MHFQRLLLLFVASNSGKRYWDWTLPRIRAQIELSTTFVYDYKMSTSGFSAKNSHLTQRGRTTMMPMPVNRITSQCKIKLSQKYCPWIDLQPWNFCHSFLQLMGSFFLIILFCSTIHVYTNRFADMGIIAIRPPWMRCEFLAELLRMMDDEDVEDALQYIKMYVAGVWTKTAKGYYKNVEEEVIRLHSKVWSNL